MSDAKIDQLHRELMDLQDQIVNLRGDPDDARQPLAVASNSRGVSNYALRLRQRRLLKGHYGKIYALHWASDSRRLLSASQDGRLIVWNGMTMHKIYAIPLRSSWVMTCAYSPSGAYVACGGLDNICSIYKLPRQRDYQPNSSLSPEELSQHEGYLSCCRFISDTKILTSSGDATCILWDAERKIPEQIFQDHGADVMSVAPYENGGVFVSGSCDATAKVWDYRVRKACQFTFPGHESDINSVSMFPNGHSFGTGSDDSSCRLYDMRALQQLQRFTDPKILCGITSVDFNKNGRVLFAGYDDDRCIAWDTLTGKQIQNLDESNNGHSNRVSCLQVSPDGSALCTGSWDTFLKIWA